jgi:hypothetical protein
MQAHVANFGNEFGNSVPRGPYDALTATSDLRLSFVPDFVAPWCEAIVHEEN